MADQSQTRYDILFVFTIFSKVFHVRSVTQGDVIRADAKEIPRIFQLLYAGEGEARRPDEQQLDISTLRGVSADERPGTKIFKGKLLLHRWARSKMKNSKFFTLIGCTGHEFLQISYHMPTTPCEVCSKPLWHMFKPPAAYECKR